MPSATSTTTRPKGPTSAALGIALAALTAVALLQRLPEAVDGGTWHEVSAYGSFGLMALAMLVAIRAAISLTSKGFAQALSLRVARPRGPAFWSNDAVALTMSREELARATTNSWEARILAGVSRFFIIAPPWFRAGGEVLLNHGSRLAIWGLVLVIGVPVIERVLDNQSVLDLLTGNGANIELSIALANLRDNLTAAPGLVLLLVGLGSMAAVWAYSPLALSPLSLSQDSQRLDGAVFAQDIPVRLREELERVAWDGERASTYWERDDATSEASVMDTGTVRLRTIIESPVSLEEDAVPSYWLVPAITGVVITMLAFAIYYAALPAASDFVPRDRADVLNGPLVPTALWTLAVLLVAGVGPLLVQTARLMAGVYHYRSTVVYVEIDGSFTRSEVNVGKARTDSIESRNLVVRSNLVLRYFVAEVASESLDLNATRRLIALDSTASTDAMLPTLQTVLRDQVEAGVAPVSIDLGATGTQRGVASNLATLQASASALAAPPIDVPAIAPTISDRAPDAPTPPPESAPTSDAEPSSRGALGRLSELQAIFDAGHLTAEEFEQKKAEIISEL